MLRRILAAIDRDHAVAAVAFVGALFALGYVQQTDEAAQMAQDSQRKTAVAAKE
ncbi:hypothetical protein [Bordetella avium]|uniref:hypothetical protein n=1 Tax=Bordetella avium TaxID=521 RepID=UPI0013E3AE43|nr:hypothetical protein [Bordetella avium]